MKLKKLLLVIGLILFITACKDVDDSHHMDNTHHENSDDHYDPSHVVSSDSARFETEQTKIVKRDDIETEAWTTLSLLDAPIT